MRLALIVPGFSAGEPDWAIPALQNLVRVLAQAHDVQVFALRYPPLRQVYTLHGATVHPFASPAPGAGAGGIVGVAARLLLHVRVLAHLLREARRARFDLVHGFWADDQGVLAVLAGRLLRRPALVSVMGGELVGLEELGYGGQLSRSGRLLVRFALAHADAVTVGSRTLAATLNSSWRLRQEPQVLSLGVDVGRFRPGAEAAPLAGSPRLLHVASLAPVKDQATLLQALALVRPRYPGVCLHIVGAGALLPALQEQARQLNLAGNLRFHGAVPHDQLPAWYRSADLCLLSSRYESQSLVALEAAACERVTAGTAVGLLPDLLPAGCLAPPGDAAGLAHAVLGLLDDEAGRQELGRALRRRVEHEFALEVTAQNLVALYNRLA